MVLLLNQWCDFDAFQKNLSPNNVWKNLVYESKHYLCPFGLSSNLNKWDKHSRVVAMFLQKTQTCVDGFKLHTVLTDRKKIWPQRENRVIQPILPMCLQQNLSTTILCSLIPSKPNNVVSLLPCHKAKKLEEKTYFMKTIFLWHA